MNRITLHGFRRGLAYAARPWIRWEWPGWMRICGPLGLSIRSDALWAGLPPVVIRGKRHGFRMRLQLEDWSDRLTYFLGRYYDLESQLLLETALEPGDTFVDIGANIGMLTLTAARRIGPAGRLLAFEPNPRTVERLRQLVEMNHLANVTLFPMGLGDRNEELTLQVVNESSGWASFVPRPPQPELTYQSVQVPVRRGDEVLPQPLGENVLVKIDAEGFECRILKGMEHCLRLGPAVMTEVEPELLQNAGSSVDELRRLLEQQGYSAFCFDAWHGQLRLRPWQPVKGFTGSRNILWLRPDSVFQKRLVTYLG